MSKYTIELREILVLGYNIFDFDYYLDTNSGLTKEQLETSFKNHYFFDEIGVETIEQFKNRLKFKWLEVLKNYNKIFVEQKKMYENFNPMLNYKNKNKTVFNDTPKGEIDFDTNHATNYTVQDNEGFAGVTQLQQFNNMKDNINDAVNSFVNEFRSLFMLVY